MANQPRVAHHIPLPPKKVETASLSGTLWSLPPQNVCDTGLLIAMKTTRLRVPEGKSKSSAHHKITSSCHSLSMESSVPHEPSFRGWQAGGGWGEGATPARCLWAQRRNGCKLKGSHGNKILMLYLIVLLLLLHHHLHHYHHHVSSSCSSSSAVSSSSVYQKISSQIWIWKFIPKSIIRTSRMVMGIRTISSRSSNSFIWTPN